MLEHRGEASRAEDRPGLAVGRTSDGGGDELGAYIAAAAKEFDQVLVQLEATTPEQNELETWVAAGLTGLSLRVEGHEQDLHARVALGTESVRRRAVSISQLRAHASHASALGSSLHIRTRLARSNFRSLDAILGLVVALGARSWTVELPRLVHGEAPPEGVAHGAPPLALCVPWALRALSRAEKRGLACALRGVPLCLVGPHSAWAVAPDQRRGHVPVCERCPSRAACTGVSSTYLERFGAGELRATQTPPPQTSAWWTVANCI